MHFIEVSLSITSFNRDFIIATGNLIGSTCSKIKRQYYNAVRMHGLQEIRKRFVLCFTTEVISPILEEAEVVHVLCS